MLPKLWAGRLVGRLTLPLSLVIHVKVMVHFEQLIGHLSFRNGPRSVG